MYETGCREELINHVRTWLLLVPCVATSVLFLLQFIVLILLRYLQTSVALAIRKGDPTADSVAYLLPICLPTDDMTDDEQCPRTPQPTAAAPSFALPPPPPPPEVAPTEQTLRQAAATLAAVGGGPPPGVDVSPLRPRSVNNSAAAAIEPALSNRPSIVTTSAYS